MVRKPALLLSLLAVLSFCGCDRLDIGGMFSEHNSVVDTRVQEWINWNNEHGYPELTVSTDEYCVYACADVHVEGYPRRFAEFVRRSNEDETSLFYMVLGDMVKNSDYLHYYQEIMPTVSDTGFCILGNHDLFFKGWEKWGEVFHTSTYYVLVETPHYTDLFIFLDSGNGTLGLNQLHWLEKVLETKRADCRHCIIGLHHNIFRTDDSQFSSGNLLLEETYKLVRLFSDYDVNLVLQGHDHWRNVTDFEGVRYVTLDDLTDGSPNASFLKIEIDATVGHKFIDMGDWK